MQKKPVRELEQTADGSHTLFIPSMNEHYHSVNGAIQESSHVFIEAGYKQMHKQNIRVLEIGFGTGLNAFLTLRQCEKEQRHVHYYTIELYPLENELIRRLNYGELIWPEQAILFQALHEAPWETAIEITPYFTLHKIQADSNECLLPEDFDLVYFDAFAPEKQPEMWNSAVFEKIYNGASPGACFVTYCAKGEVRRQLQTAGFVMERIPGPPGKRHILRGRKG